MGIEEQFGEIVIAPRVLEKIIAIATAKVEGVHSFSNKSVSDTLSKLSWSWRLLKRKQRRTNC